MAFHDFSRFSMTGYTLSEDYNENKICHKVNVKNFKTDAAMPKQDRNKIH